MAQAVSRQPLRRVKVRAVSRQPLRRAKVRAVSRQPLRRAKGRAVSRQPLRHAKARVVSRQPLRGAKCRAVSRQPLRRAMTQAISRQPLRRTTAQAVSCRLLCAEAPFKIKARSCGICGEQSGNVTGFSPSTSTFCCQYHPINAPCSSIRHRRHIISVISTVINPLKPELNPICYLLELLAHHFLHVSRIRVKSLTLR